jgi:hypothetical protein
MIKFKAEVELGNEAMLTAGDVAEVMEKIAADLRDGDPGRSLDRPDFLTVNVRDRNGNTVGYWEVHGRE